MSATSASTVSGVVSHAHMRRTPVSADERVEVPAFACSASIERHGRSTNTPLASTGASSARPARRDRFGEALRHRVGVRGVREPRAAVEHAEPRRGEKAHLRRELPALLAAARELVARARDRRTRSPRRTACRSSCRRTTARPRRRATRGRPARSRATPRRWRSARRRRGRACAARARRRASATSRAACRPCRARSPASATARAGATNARRAA